MCALYIQLLYIVLSYVRWEEAARHFPSSMISGDPSFPVIDRGKVNYILLNLNLTLTLYISVTSGSTLFSSDRLDLKLNLFFHPIKALFEMHVTAIK